MKRLLMLFLPSALLLAQAGKNDGRMDEGFDYFQDGSVGHGVHQVWTIDLGGEVTMELVRIPSGRFQMGSPREQKQRLADEELHDVRIARDFYLGKYEVTQRQFAAFVQATGYRTEPETDGQGGWGYNESTGAIEGRKPKYSWKFTGIGSTDDHPVTNVTWNDAEAFCRWLAERTKASVRLPTEAEWEYACRAGSTAPFYSGNDIGSLTRVANFADATAKQKFPEWGSPITAADGYVFSAPVGRFLPNKYGLYDMLGNAWEWCADCYGPYADLGAEDPFRNEPLNARMNARVMRGGGFGKRTPRVCSSSRRVAGAASSRDIDLGFRIFIRTN